MTGNAQYRQLGISELYDFPVYQIFPYRDAFRLHRQAECLGLLLGRAKALHVRFMGFRAQSVGVMDEFVTEYMIQMEVRTKVTFQRQPVLAIKSPFLFVPFAQAAAIDMTASLVSSYSKCYSREIVYFERFYQS